MNDGTQLALIKQAQLIVVKGNLLAETHDVCAHPDELESLLIAWLELIRLYETNYSGIMIPVEVVRDYLYWVSRLATIWHDETKEQECRNLAEEAVIQLEWSLNEIIKLVERRIYPNGR